MSKETYSVPTKTVMVRVMRCLLCDATDKPFRRIRPHKIYACEPCVKENGGPDQILANMDNHVRAFELRHKKVA